MNSKTNWKQDLKSPWLLAILGIVFSAVIANTVLITVSNVYPHSLVAKDYYGKGKEYFHARLTRENKAERLGYTVTLTVGDKLKAGVEDKIFLKVVDRDGKNVNGENAKLFAYRVNDEKKDFKIILQKNLIGQYESKTIFPLPGKWDLIGQITISGESFDVAKRIHIGK